MIPRLLVRTGVYICTLLVLIAGESYPFQSAQAQGVPIDGEVSLGPANESAPVFEFVADGLPPAPDGYHYGLWSLPLDAQPMLLAELDAGADSARIAAIDDLSFALADGFELALSVDRNEASAADGPYHIAATMALPEGVPAALLGLLASGSGAGNGALIDALTQVDVAQQHSGFIADSIDEGSLAMARNHAEHVVNILDGEAGMFFGDLNRDGQAQNPGDGYGVRAYVEDAIAALETLTEDGSLPDDETAAIDSIVQSLNESQAHVSEAREQALKLYAIDTDAEAQGVHDDLAGALDLLLTSLDGSLASVYSLVRFPMSIDIASLTPPVEMHEMGEVRMLIEMSSEGVVDFGGFHILMTELPAMLIETPLELWAMDEESEPVLMGGVEIDEVDDPYSEGLESDFVSMPSQVAVTAGTSSAANPAPVLMSGQVSPEILAAVTALISENGANGAGSLQSAAEQTSIAQAHTGFIQDAIDTDNLMMARNHAEHTVNILDGESGMFYGDLNRDGQAQNPGDGYGVRVYLTDAFDNLSHLQDTASLSEAELQTVQHIQEGIDLALSNVSEAEELAIKLYAIDTLDEATAVHDELAAKLDALLAEILMAANQTPSLAVYRLMADPAVFIVEDESEATSDEIEAEAGDEPVAEPVDDIEESGAITETLTVEPTAEVTTTAPASGTISYTPPPPDADEGDRWTNAVDGGEYVYIPGSVFVIGSESDKASSREAPVHEVKLDGYWMQVTETTNAQYRLCVEAGVCTEPENDIWDDEDYAQHPVANVDWQQASAYATWSGARLPTEAEWEAACRSVNGNTYPWGDNAPTDELSNFGQDQEETAPVGSYPDGATASGIFDLAGNVWEWTSSLDAMYPYVAEDGREAVDDDGSRTMRGGSFYYDSLLLRCSARTGAKPGTSIPHLGFRTVVDGGETEFTSATDGGVYVYVPGGEYTIGSDSDLATQREQPISTVSIDSYWLQKTETTNAQYATCVADGVCAEPDNDVWDDDAFADHPVANVSWFDALDYAEWAGARLPTEAEWEIACSGPDNGAYPWGNLAPSDALSNFGETIGETVPVGSYPDGAATNGALDMSGNVWEWTSSTNDLYPYDAADGREALDGDGRRTMRGGSFYYDSVFLRCSARTGVNPTTQIPHLGFRTARPAR